MNKVYAILMLLLSPCVYAQSLAERGTPLDHLAGSWVMTGTIAGDEIVHDVRAEWVLDGHYLFIHELARERDEEGKRAYEARIYMGWDEASQGLVCLWLDVTGGGGLVPDGLGYGVPGGDRIPFVWGAGSDSQIHNTFSYLRDTDQWAWHIDNVRQGEPSEFARVKLSRVPPEPASSEVLQGVEQGIEDAISRLYQATAPGGDGVEVYEAILTEDFSRWTLSSEAVQNREALIESIQRWLDEGWRVASRESLVIDSTVKGDRAYTHRVVTETYRDPEGEVTGPSTFALEETWQNVDGRWLLRQVIVYPVVD